MDYILQLAEYKQKNNKQKLNKYERIKNIILATLKNEKAILYDSTQLYEFQDEKDRFIIYALRPLHIANAITNAIFEVYSKYVAMSTRLVDKEFSINIDNENIIDIILFIPIDIDAYYIIPKSIIKAIAFRKLYSIQNYYKIEKDDKEHILKHCIKDIVIGGKSINPDEKKYASNPLKMVILQELYNRMKGNAFINNNVAFLSYLEELTHNIPINFNVTMNIILLNEVVYSMLIQLLKDVVQTDTSYSLKIKEHVHFYIPNDFRLSKTTIYLQSKDQKRSKIYLCNIFNSGTYEILPILKKYEVLIPDQLVILKFLYIDLFFADIHSHYRKIIADSILFILKTFHVQDGIIIWRGIYKDEGNDKINVNLNCKKDLTIYRPWEYFSIHQRLRIL